MESAKSGLTSLTVQATRSIDLVAREVTDNANSIADQLSSGELTHKAAQIRLRKLLERYPHFLSAALSYKPYAFDPDGCCSTSYGTASIRFPIRLFS